MRRASVCLLVLLLVTISADPALAQDNIAKSLLGRFISQTDGWWAILRGYALFLFTTTLVLEVCLFGIRIALQQTNIGETFGQFVMLLLFAGFIAAVIMNYQEWATGIAIKGLQPLTGQLTGNSVDAGQPVAMAAAIMEKIIPVMEDAGITDFGEVYLYVSCMLLIMVIFVLISALVILTTCEFYILANVGVLLIGLGGSKIFKDYAVNVMRYILAVAVKLFVLQLIVNIGFAIISLTDLDATVGSTLDSIKFTDLFFLIGKAIILLALAKSLPDTCSGIINGSAVGGGNPMASMARTAGVMAAGAVTAGAGYAVGALRAANAAHTIAKSEGATSVVDTASRMVQAGVQAFKDARAGAAEKALQQEPGSMKNQLVSGAYASQAMSLLNEGGSSNSSGGSSLPDSPSSPSGESGQSGVGAPGGSETPVQPSGFTGQTGPSAPASGTAGGSGQVTPSSSTVNGQAGPADSGGASGEPASPVTSPAPAPTEAGSPTQSPKPSKDDHGPRPTPKGTVDMRTFDPSTFKK